MGTIQTTVFAPLLSYSICELLVKGGGTLLIFGHGVKGQCQIWHSACESFGARYRLEFAGLLSYFTCKLKMRRGGTMHVDFESIGQRSWLSLTLFLWILVDTLHVQSTFFLIAFIIHMLVEDEERRIPSELCHWDKCQDHHWHSACKILRTQYRLQFSPDHFQTLLISCWWWEEEPYCFFIMGQEVKVNFDTLPVNPFGCDLGYSFCAITFKFHK